MPRTDRAGRAVRGTNAGAECGSAIRHDQRFNAILSYLDDDNVHVFEAALNIMIDRRATWLSSLLSS